MSALFLPSFEARGFRAFEDLRIERLGRVNLIVGKNNVGKSSLLEALQVYANKGSLPILWDLLVARDEGNERSVLRSRETPEEQFGSLTYLFHGWNRGSSTRYTMQLGPINDLDRALKIEMAWNPGPGDVSRMLEDYANRPEGELDTPSLAIELHPILGVQIGSLEGGHFYDLRNARYSSFERGLVRCVSVPANGLSKAQIGELWDQIALTDSQQAVQEALKAITPGVMGLSMVAEPRGNGRERIPIVRISQLEKPIPVKSLGDGMQRMLGIALALVNAKDGILLIDEVENGLHYQVLPQLWRLVFQTAQRLNVQVFATTHSWDCVQAFQSVADADQGTEGLLIRLEMRKGKVVATLFDERELAIATREQIEVR